MKKLIVHLMVAGDGEARPDHGPKLVAHIFRQLIIKKTPETQHVGKIETSTCTVFKKNCECKL